VSKLDELVENFDVNVETMWEGIEEHIKGTREDYKNDIRAYIEERFGPLVKMNADIINIGEFPDKQLADALARAKEE